MSKFNAATGRTSTGPISVERTPSTITAQGGDGYLRDAKSELFMLAVSNMVGEKTFYEAASDRDDRFRDLVHVVALTDGVWMRNFIAWLRADANMRSASIVAAAESAYAMLTHKVTGSRSIVSAAIQRPDEPGEMLAYWTSRYGRNIPKPVKRGVADAVARLYNERALLKYDSDAKGYRFGDVLDVTHPTPVGAWQGDLFKYALDRRHKRDDIEIPESLTVLRKRADLAAMPKDERRKLVVAAAMHGENFAKQMLAESGMTWESLAGWLDGPMDRAAWEAIIPSMGVMALMRNLRNFDEAGVSDEVAEKVAAKLSDPEAIAKSRLFPMRFLSAYKAAPSLRWGPALEKGVQLSTANVPSLSGSSLILWDCSGSMFYDNVGGGRSTLTRAEAAGVFCGALAMRAERATLVQYGTQHKIVPVPKGGSLLKLVTEVPSMGGTNTWQTVRDTYRNHDRVIIVTDEQAHDSGYVADSIPVYTWNLGGYRAAHIGSGKNRWAFGGLTDQAFQQIPTIEAGRVGNWDDIFGK